MPKTAVVLHVFYDEAAQGPLSTLKKVEAEFDLFVTASKPLSPSLAESVRQSGRRTRLIERPGAGQDLALFLSLIPNLAAEGYQAVCKLHTKRDPLTDLGERWRRIGANAVIGTSARFSQIQALFEADDKLAFVGSKSLYVSAEAYMYESYGDVVEILRASYPDAAINSDWGFFAGSVFWARPHRLEPLSLAAASAGFGKSQARDDELAHALERAVGFIRRSERAKIGLIAADSRAEIEIVPAPGKPSRDAVNRLPRRSEDSNVALPELVRIFKQGNPLADYIRYGEKQGTRPNPIFDPRWYLKKYPDVRKTGTSPLRHFMRFGAHEMRDPAPDFDTRQYLARNPDVLFSGMAAARHHLHHRTNAAIPPSATESYLGVWKKFIPLLQQLGDTVFTSTAQLPRGFLDRCREAVARRPVQMSVVVPAWNRAAVIGRAVESLLAQSLPVHQIVVVDDGSTDSTEETVHKRFAAEIEKGQLVFVKTPHQGVSAARNAGVAHATGELVAYLDSDNTWNRDYVLIMSAMFAQNPALPAAYCGLNFNFADRAEKRHRANRYSRRALLQGNFIDLNCFVHRRQLYLKAGGFDESLSRLVDWEFVLRVTKHHPPAFVPILLVEYYLDKENLKNITFTEDLDANYQRAARKHRRERVAHEVEPLRIGYIIWDFPALSQTFVLNELRWLVEKGHDVIVYYKIKPDLAAKLDFDMVAMQVESAEELARFILRDGRNVLHSHFAYPATTLLAWPAAQATGVPFSFMVHAVDITHEANRSRNRLAEMANDELCIGVITLGSFHHSFLLATGVPNNKIIVERQAVDLPDYRPLRDRGGLRLPRAISMGRFIEKKGFGYLIEAAAQLPDVDFVIYGYGPIEQELREQIERLGLPNVTLPGVLEGKAAVDQAYAEADLFVLPCVEASNGDMDGLPTVLLEAMAAGVPVITTKLTNIPDLVIEGVTGFLVEPRDTRGLVRAIRDAIGLDFATRNRLIETARRYVLGFASPERLMATLTSTWVGRTVDIILVTYDTPKYPDAETTFEIIDRVYRYTTMPFNLIVVDNNSQEPFRKALIERYGARPNFLFVPLEENIFVGPATNIGIELGQSEYAIYLCSKEGFILQNGWERRMVQVMDANPLAAMGGYPLTVPKFTTGAEHIDNPTFSRWRNQHFALDNPQRPFWHLQGGALIIRRSAYEAVGGFSTAVPQDHTDMELSYYLESCGYELAAIPDIYAITTKTRPSMHTLLNEQALLAHPLTRTSAKRYDELVARQVKHCNLCDWQGQDFDWNGGMAHCPACGSTPFARSAQRYLSQSSLLQQRPKVIGFGDLGHLKKTNAELLRDFSVIEVSPSAALEQLNDALARSRSCLVIFDHLAWPAGELRPAAAAFARHLEAGGRCIVGESLENTLLGAMNDEGIMLEEVGYVSRCVAYDPYAIAAAGFPRPQGYLA